MNETESSMFFLRTVLIVPDCFNFLLLFAGMYGMYHGVEINHPIFAVLFLDLSMAWAFTTLDLAAFAFVATPKFVTISNSGSVMSLMFHCSCWCVASVVRYVYIVHENRLHDVMPNHRTQCLVAGIAVFVLIVSLAGPTFAYAAFVGKRHVRGRGSQGSRVQILAIFQVLAPGESKSLNKQVMEFFYVNCFCTGWPKVQILAKPVSEIFPVVLLGLNSYLLPITVSCVIYLKLIGIKRRLFVNSVSALVTDASTDARSVPAGGHKASNSSQFVDQSRVEQVDPQAGF